MSGLKKFKQTKSVASVCVTFDPKKGTLSKINVTSDGKSSGLEGYELVHFNNIYFLQLFFFKNLIK